MGGGNEAINEAGVVQHHLILKDDELIRFGHSINLLQQRKPKDLTVTLFVPLAGPVGGKLFCGCMALCICHGSILPKCFSYRIPQKGGFFHSGEKHMTFIFRYYYYDFSFEVFLPCAQ